MTVRVRTGAILLGVVPAGFYTKFYAGPGAQWVRDSLGGVFYDVFWCLGIFLLRPGWPPGGIAAGVLAATCALECLQLWHPPVLEVLRSTFVGRTVLGTSFSWGDFPYYAAGCGMAWAWMRFTSVDFPVPLGPNR